MLCQKCGKKEAVVHVVCMVNNKQIDKWLCADCAEKLMPYAVSGGGRAVYRPGGASGRASGRSASALRRGIGADGGLRAGFRFVSADAAAKRAACADL
mgnify:CR=1 FL=1